MTKKRLKLCPHCEGQVELDIFVCPFCGGNIPAEIKGDSLSPEETLASLYPPPYQPKVVTQLEEAPQEVAMEETQKKTENTFIAVGPVICFSFGLNLFLFSLFLWIFSQEGRVVLAWSGKIGWIYILLSLPLLYFGYKGLKKEAP